MERESRTGSERPEPEQAEARTANGGSDGERRKARYDRAFQAAILDGCLTIQEAIERGNRKAYAAALRKRYNLTVELALQVADGRIRLYQAIRAVDVRIRPPELEPPKRFPLSRSQIVVVLAVLGTSMLAIGDHGMRLWERQRLAAWYAEQHWFGADRSGDPRTAASDARPMGPVIPPAEVVRDETGQVTRIAAPHPSRVLEAVCREITPSRQCASMELRPADPPFPGNRLGRIVDPAFPEEVWTVHIRRDRRNGDWAIGDGVHVLDPNPTPGPS